MKNIPYLAVAAAMFSSAPGAEGPRPQAPPRPLRFAPGPVWRWAGATSASQTRRSRPGPAPCCDSTAGPPRNHRSAARAAAGRGVRRTEAAEGGHFRAGAAGRPGLAAARAERSSGSLRSPGQRRRGPASQPLVLPSGSVAGLPFRRESPLRGRGSGFRGGEERGRRRSRSDRRTRDG